jgi:hypothetical protein
LHRHRAGSDAKAGTVRVINVGAALLDQQARIKPTSMHRANGGSGVGVASHMLIGRLIAIDPASMRP